MNQITEFVSNNKPTFFIFLSVFMGVLIIGSITLILLSHKTKNINPSSSSPSPTPQIEFNNPNITPSIQYEENSTKKMLNIISTRPKLSDSDLKARSQIIQSIGDKSGILSQTNDYILEYINSPDAFMSEVLITDINKSKQETVDWLKSKGLSQDGICKLPLVFYLNSTASDALEQTGEQFNPLPDGC